MFENSYNKILNDFGLIQISNLKRFGNLGKCYSVPPDIGKGVYWIYEPNNLFNIKIHDFYFHKDFIFDMKLPEGLSIVYYESVSGEELSPYKRMEINIVRSHLGGEKPFRALIHKKVPIKSVGIEIKPEFYKNYLQTNYPAQFDNLYDVFSTFEETAHFYQMINLLKQLESYRGEGAAGMLFYEAKIVEAISILYEHRKNQFHSKINTVTKPDKEIVKTISMYIRDHYANELTQEMLTKIACISATKLKKVFKLVNNCTITEYIQNCRIGQAQHLLQYTDLAISQVAKAVGYNNASRFTELFKKNTGLLPREYRKAL